MTDPIEQIIRWVDSVAPVVLAVALLVWLVLMAGLFAGRLLSDRYFRIFHAIEGEQDAAAVERILSGLPGGVVSNAALDPGTPARMAPLLARHALSRLGAQRVVRAASKGGGPGGDNRRVRALRLLALAGHSELLRHLDAALHSGREEVVDAVVSMLGTLKQEEAANLLVAALRERLFPMSRVATELEHFHVEIPHLIRPLLDSTDPALRYWGAALASRYVYVDGFAGSLLRLARDAEPHVRKAAMRSLRHSSITGVEREAARLIGDPVYYVRVHAARTLAATQDPGVAPHIVPLLSDPNWWVRVAARESLASLGPSVAPAVVPLLWSAEAVVAEGAAEILHNVGYVDEMFRKAAEYREEQALRLLKPLAIAGGELLISAVVARYPAAEMPALARLEPALRRAARR